MLKWLVAALGALLIVGGAMTAVEGWSIVQVERGWSQVIAGVTAATGGCIILALAALASRVDALLASVDQIRRGALPVVAPVPIEVARAARAPSLDTTAQANPEEAPPPGATEPAPLLQESAGRVEPEPPRPAPTARVRSSWLPRPKRREQAAPEQAAPFVDQAFAAIPPRETDFPTGPWPASEGPASALADMPLPEKQNGEGSHSSQPTLVRRYESGGVSYQLYSDGSIAAQTESGSFRFASLSELREFIANKP